MGKLKRPGKGEKKMENYDPLLADLEDPEKLKKYLAETITQGHELMSQTQLLNHVICRLEARLNALEMRERLIEEDENMQKKINQKRMSQLGAWT